MGIHSDADSLKHICEHSLVTQLWKLFKPGIQIYHARVKGVQGLSKSHLKIILSSLTP